MQSTGSSLYNSLKQRVTFDKIGKHKVKVKYFLVVYMNRPSRACSMNLDEQKA